jgi:hypothetical protein
VTERLHPYDMVFGTTEFEEEKFPAIRDEAEARDVDVRDAQRFIMLETVGDLMRSLLPPDADVPATTQFAAIVTHAFHYWLAGKRTVSLGQDVLRALLTRASIGSWDMAPPSPAGYVQLPRNLVFARVDEDAHAEAIDGFFFVMPGGNDPAVPPYQRLDVLMVLGVMPNRAGFSVINVSTPVPADAPGHFGDVVAREEGEDFENVLPGGEGRLFAVTNELEVLKLAARCFWWATNRG